MSRQDFEEVIAEQAKTNALKILKDKNLFLKITKDEFDKKIVGEIETRQIIFLCGCAGRLVINSQIASFNLLINDVAGTGKDYITGAVLEILPKSVYIHKTRISPTVFNYWHTKKREPNWTWDGKTFYCEDISENVLNSDVFKVMTSKGSNATIVVNQKAVDLEIVGKPVMITTTASAVPNPELTRRFAILSLDSSEEQTKQIMVRHSKYKQLGIIPEYDEEISDSLRYLQRHKVKIPFGSLIPQHFPIKNVMMRTQYPRFLDFIAASCALHQFQRETDNDGFLLATSEDYNLARKLFLRLCSNRYMISLTINQKKILECFEKDTNLQGSITQLHQYMNFISDRALATNLNQLCNYGLLENSIQKDTWNRDLVVYSLAKTYNPNEKINIPTFEEINRITSKPSEPSTHSIPSLPSEAMEGIEATFGWVLPTKKTFSRVSDSDIKPFPSNCSNCNELSPIHWIDQDKKPYCVRCKIKLCKETLNDSKYH